MTDIFSCRPAYIKAPKNISAHKTLLIIDNRVCTKNVSPCMLVVAAKSLKTCSKPMIEKCSPKLLEIVWVLAKV